MGSLAVRAGPPRADGAASGSRRPSTTLPSATGSAPTRPGLRLGQHRFKPTRRRSSHANPTQTCPSCGTVGVTAPACITPPGRHVRHAQVDAELESDTCDVDLLMAALDDAQRVVRAGLAGRGQRLRLAGCSPASPRTCQLPLSQLFLGSLHHGLEGAGRLVTRLGPVGRGGWCAGTPSAGGPRSHRRYRGAVCPE